jgi:hypothetical protein
LYVTVSGFQIVTFTGATKSFIIQYRSPNGATVTCRRARMELFRVA